MGGFFLGSSYPVGKSVGFSVAGCFLAFQIIPNFRPFHAKTCSI